MLQHRLKRARHPALSIASGRHRGQHVRVALACSGLSSQFVSLMPGGCSKSAFAQAHQRRRRRRAMGPHSEGFDNADRQSSSPMPVEGPKRFADHYGLAPAERWVFSSFELLRPPRTVPNLLASFPVPFEKRTRPTPDHGLGRCTRPRPSEGPRASVQSGIPATTGLGCWCGLQRIPA